MPDKDPSTTDLDTAYWSAGSDFLFPFAENIHRGGTQCQVDKKSSESCTEAGQTRGAQETPQSPGESILMAFSHEVVKVGFQPSPCWRIECEIKKLTRSCFLIPQIIQRQLEQVEEKQRQLEERGVAVEKALRGEAGISLFLSHFIPEMRCWRVKALEQIFITHAFLCSYTLTFRSKLLAVFSRF